MLIDGDALVSFNLDAPEISKPRRESDFRHLFGEATDLRFIEDTRQEEVIKLLTADYEKSCALDLALMLLDEDISETKPLIGEALEELFTDEGLIVYLENIFYAEPLPPGADTENALAVCESRSPKTYNWLSTLIEKQEDIFLVRKVWNEIPTDIFGGEQERDDFQKAFVREGYFRQLVLHCKNKLKINFLYIEAAKNSSIISLPNQRTVLQNLFAPFKQSLVSREEIRLQKDEQEEIFTPKQKKRQRINREEVVSQCSRSD